MANPEIHVLSIQEEMTIYAANDIKEKFLAELDKEGIIEIDLSEVTEFDSTGYQLLIACKREAANRKKTINIKNPSSVVTEVLNLYKETSLLTHSEVS